MGIPTRPWTLMAKTYVEVLPCVHRYLNEWKNRAQRIPDPELRSQALASIATKTFHCEGGAISSLLAGRRKNDAIRFIVAYQTISDYLDNLCDRSTSLEAEDFRSLHESMRHALTPGTQTSNYYHRRKEQDDGGYLSALVSTCQEVLETVSSYREISPYLHQLAGYYCDLQVFKRVEVDQRIPSLNAWFDSHKERYHGMSWYEFAACTGSTLGIFCLVSYAISHKLTKSMAGKLMRGYFPWVQGLHILLDYFVDQEEDRIGGDLNFCYYYENDRHLVDRLSHFVKKADESIALLPHASFHRMINRGLLGIYLADRKVGAQRNVKHMAHKIGRAGGLSAFFFYINGWLYRRLRPG